MRPFTSETLKPDLTVFAKLTHITSPTITHTIEDQPVIIQEGVVQDLLHGLKPCYSSLQSPSPVTISIPHDHAARDHLPPRAIFLTQTREHTLRLVSSRGSTLGQYTMPR